MGTHLKRTWKRARCFVKWTALAATVLLALAWIALARKGPQVGYVGEDTVVWVFVCGGQLGIRHNAMDVIDGPHKTGWGAATIANYKPFPYLTLRFRWDGLGPDWFIYIPLWVFWLPLAALTTYLWWPAIQSRRWRRRGRCPNCGYDPAGLAANAPCPECGLTTP